MRVADSLASCNFELRRMEEWKYGGSEGWEDGGSEGWEDEGSEGWQDGRMDGIAICITLSPCVRERL